jgi:hypothetical protein
MMRFQKAFVDKIRSDGSVTRGVPVIYDAQRDMAAPFPVGWEENVDWEIENSPPARLASDFIFVPIGVKQYNGNTYYNLRDAA